MLKGTLYTELSIPSKVLERPCITADRQTSEPERGRTTVGERKESALITFMNPHLCVPDVLEDGIFHFQE